jgi:hypothetical protein
MCKSETDLIYVFQFFKQTASRSWLMTPKSIFYHEVEAKLLQAMELKDAAGKNAQMFVRVCVGVYVYAYLRRNMFY